VAGVVGAIVGVVAVRVPVPYKWEALAGVGTLAVAVVAVAPIWFEARRRRGQATGLRLLLITYLTALRPFFAAPEERCRHARDVREAEELRGNPRAPLTAFEVRPIHAIARLIPRVHLLDAEEHDRLAAAYLTLYLVARAPQLTEDTATGIIRAIDAAIEALDRRGILRRDMPTVPLPPH